MAELGVRIPQRLPFSKSPSQQKEAVIKNIQKRGGNFAEFDPSKIRVAIKKAYDAVGIDLDPTVAESVVKQIESMPHSIGVEEIQNLAEREIRAKNPDVADCFQAYRDEQTRQRERNSPLTKALRDLTGGNSEAKRENANVDGNTAMGTMLQYGSEGARSIALADMNPLHAKAHKEGLIHIHDLDFYNLTTTCCQIDLKQLFSGGFSTGHGTLREPNDIRSYSALACIAIQSNQNDQHGGQSVANFDYALGDGVRKTFAKECKKTLADTLSLLGENDVEGFVFDYDEWEGKPSDVLNELEMFLVKLTEVSNPNRVATWILKTATRETERATFQAMEALIHNLNTMHSRAGAQTPFSSINYGMDTSPAGRLVTKSLLLAQERGLGNGETPIFPIHIFRVKKGVNYEPNEPNYDLFKLAMRVSAKRLFPNFSFLDAPFNLEYYKEGRPETEIGYMGCVHRGETISYRIDGKLYRGGIGRAYAKVKSLFGEKTHGVSNYVDTDGKVEICDSSSEPKYVNCKKFILNPNKDNWFSVMFSNKLALLATADHPFPVLGKGRTKVERLEVGDLIPSCDQVTGDPKPPLRVVSVEEISCREESYDVETESDYFNVSGVISHNCRTRVMSNAHDPSREISFGRGNLSFTSVNLPRLAIESSGDLEKFFASLDDTMNLCIDQLLERLKVQGRKTPLNSPFLMGANVWIDSEKLAPTEPVLEILKHGTLSVGFIGLAEALTSLVGSHQGESEESQELGLKIIDRMRSRLDEETKARKLNFSLISSPGEGLSGRFVGIDRAKYGSIEGVTNRDYYTNGFHVPVHYPINAFKKIQLEAPYHALTNAGHITYVELDGAPSENLEAFESIIRAMCEAGIGYGSVNHPLDRDPVCGYSGVIGDRCPQCGRKEDEVKFERIRRITGYLVGTLERFNNAKLKEVEARVRHDTTS